MTNDDPFFDGQDQDRTVLKPTPGKRRGGAAPAGAGAPGPAAPPPGPPPAAPAAAPAAVGEFVTPGLNPLVDAAGGSGCDKASHRGPKETKSSRDRSHIFIILPSL